MAVSILLGELEAQMKERDIRRIPDSERAYIDVEVSEGETRRFYLAHERRKAVTCWLCGGDSEQTCQCHNHPHSGRALPCDMVCDA